MALTDDFLEVLKARSNTYRFTTQRVQERHLRLVLEAGRWAPSCLNIQPWHFLVVTDPERIEKLAAAAKYLEFHCNPQVLILVLLRAKRWKDDLKKYKLTRKLGWRHAYMSLAMAVIQMDLEANSLGLAGEILVPNEKKVRKIVQLPSTDKVAFMLGLGYASRKEGARRVRGRRPLSDLVSYEKL